MSREGWSNVGVRYWFDEDNHLVVEPQDGPADRLRPVRVVEGVVTTDSTNRLVYRVEAAAAAGGDPRPRRYELDGNWALTPRHELQLTLHGAEQERRQRLYLNGAIVDATAHALTFALDRREQDGRRTVQRLSLQGRWQADRRNRLTFLVDKADGSVDRLTFQGAWTVNRRQTLRYQYRRRIGRRLERTVHTVRWAGVWDITRANRLVYRVDGSTDSTFDFQVSLQRPSLRAQEGRVVYQVGIGLSGQRTRIQQVAVFGQWKLHRDLSVSFEVPYADGRRGTIRFGATYAFSRQREVTVELLDAHRRPLGISVTFSQRWREDAQWFMQLGKAGEGVEALGGVHVRF